MYSVCNNSDTLQHIIIGLKYNVTLFPATKISYSIDNDTAFQSSLFNTKNISYNIDDDTSYQSDLFNTSNISNNIYNVTSLTHHQFVQQKYIIDIIFVPL